MTLRPTALLFLLTALMLATVTVACEPGTTVPVENATTSTLTLFYETGLDATPRFTLQPFESKRIVIPRRGWRERLIAKDSSGRVVFDQRITWDQLERMEKIVIESSP